MMRRYAGLLLIFLANSSLGQTTLPAGGSQPIQRGQPSLVINQVIKRSGQLPSSESSGLTIGMVQWVGASSQTEQFSQPNANGALYSSLAPENQVFFSVIGTAFATGGPNTFNAPDLRGRFSFAPGNFDWGGSSVLGEVQGVAQSILSINQLPAHQHVVNSNGVLSPTQGAGQVSPAPVSLLAPSLSLRYLINEDGAVPSPTIATPFPFVGQIQAYAGNQLPGGWLAAEGQVLQIAEHNNLYQVLGTTYGGDGVTTFALPDLRGRLPVGIGQGTALPLIGLGQKFGAPDVVLSEANLTHHVHGLPNGDSTNPSGQGQAFNFYQPSLGIQFLIALDGIFPVTFGSTLPEDLAVLSNIYGFAGNFVPRDFAACNGQLLQISQHVALFSLLGTTYGGDGQVTLGLPDLRGRSPMGSGANVNLPPGFMQGFVSRQISLSELTNHVHGIDIIDPLFSDSFE